MATSELSAIKRAMTPPEPTLEQLDELLACAERRFLRSHEKLALAAAENNDANAGLLAARAARAQFINDHPDPQLAIPFQADGE